MELIPLEFGLYTGQIMDTDNTAQILPVKDGFLPTGVYYLDRYDKTYREFAKSINTDWRKYEYKLFAIITDDKQFALKKIETKSDFKTICSIMTEETKMLSTDQTLYRFNDFNLNIGDKLELQNNCIYYFIIKQICKL